ncbi:MAG TPA: Lsr2 family protein [Jatrophihabitantaceae bacterium]
MSIADLKGKPTMAKTIVTQYTDDIDGSKAQGTVQFSYNGSAYEIDLSAKNTKALEKILDPYISAARKVRATATKAGRRRSGAASAKTDVAEIRAWAHSNGYTISDRGRIPATVIEAFQSNH